jgi:colanic acid/amylovoran biosynthesis glycosyltransferase
LAELKKKIKIAIYSGEIPSTTFIERLIKGLSAKDCKILLFGILNKKQPYSSENIIVKGYRLSRTSKAICLFYYTLLLVLFRNKEKAQLDDLLKSESRFSLYDRVKYYPVLWHKPDIFHVQWAKGLHEWLWVKTFGIKLVLSLRGAHINYSPIADPKLAEMYRINFPKVDAFHAVSKAIGIEAGKYGANQEKVKVVYSGLDLNMLNHSKSKLSVNQTTFNLISIGRPHWIKGYVYALDACKYLKDANFNFKYTIIGGESDIELAYQVHDLELDDYVELTKKMSFSEVENAIKKSDLLLLPSLEEGVANVVLEAMALERLVLSTNCGGMPEIINDGQNGFLVPIRNSIEMAKKIIEIAQLTETQKNKITNEALKTIKSNHTSEQMINGMMALYQNVLE